MQREGWANAWEMQATSQNLEKKLLEAEGSLSMQPFSHVLVNISGHMPKSIPDLSSSPGASLDKWLLEQLLLQSGKPGGFGRWKVVSITDWLKGAAQQAKMYGESLMKNGSIKTSIKNTGKNLSAMPVKAVFMGATVAFGRQSRSSPLASVSV
eukprot:CAMPEP_0175129118 /NCGR_PEP_ID=MMETSP0087-20121206/5295_1 /TAXON_ID=136419 /ORGANISM="Unknown Unknown, Strain D1" /LENGTH=152 /DNA_ID=CAMNT_0016411233 /DNA_START=916 /DNA_END=1374 /DNA_ORIENTATION=+